jgi:hypothetical protein
VTVTLEQRQTAKVLSDSLSTQFFEISADILEVTHGRRFFVFHQRTKRGIYEKSFPRKINIQHEGKRMTSPRFEVKLTDGTGQDLTVSMSEFKYTLGLGQSGEYEIVFSEGHDLLESASLKYGIRLAEIRAGFDDDLKLIARDAMIWSDSYQINTQDGETYAVGANGCIEFLRASGKRTVQLQAKTYADALIEVAARHGLKVRIQGKGAKAVIPLEESKTVTPPPQNPVTPPSATTPITSPLANLSKANQAVLGAARRIAAGLNLGNGVLTTTAKFEPNYCARFVREVVEFALGERWGVYSKASVIATLDQIEGTNAIDYLEAARALGLQRKGVLKPGDILFQDNVSLPYGHISIYIGDWNGVPSVVENTSANRGVDPYGSGTRVRVTALSSFGAYSFAASPEREDPTSNPTPAQTVDPASGLASNGVKATPKNEGANRPRTAVWQANQNDWDFLENLAAKIGYIITETEFGDELFFGLGLEESDGLEPVLVLGEYHAGGQAVTSNVISIKSDRMIWGIPSEIIVTGIENGKHFTQIVTTDDLLERHKVDPEVTTSSSKTPTPSTNAAKGLTTPGVTATAKNQTTTSNGQKTKPKTSKASNNFVGKTISELLKGANQTGVRYTVSGASSVNDARERGLETLAISQLWFQVLTVEIIPNFSLRPGQYVTLQGSRIDPKLKGRYLIRELSGAIDGNGASMTLTLNRNTERK